MAEKELNFKEKEELFYQYTGENFITMYNKYYTKLVYYTYKICKNEQKAEDISTDSFMIALNKIEKFDKNIAQFSTWLFTIARNLTLQKLKLDRKLISMDMPFDAEGTTMKDFIELPDDNSNLYNEFYDKKANIIKTHMDDLKEPYKTVLHMREIKKMPYKDIADQLDKNLSTIKSQIRNGRKILIKKSKNEFEEIDKDYL